MTVTKLLLIESPNKVHTLQEILGDEWKIIATYGHIRDLPDDEMGVSAPTYRPQYVLSERGARQVAAIKKAMATADEIYLGTDPDREGESISWHIKDACGITEYKRVRFNELTADFVRKVIAKPDKIDNQRVLAQETRRVEDRFLGYKVSPALSQIGGMKLSAGRVQSIANRIVAERELAIKFFKPTDHFGVKLDFGDWFAEWDTKPFVTEESPYVLDRELATRIAALASVTVAQFDEGRATRSPPAPFTTSTMQQAASVSLKMKTSDAMDTAQKLFEKGLITYHRTDSPNLSADAVAAIFAYCDAAGLPRAEKHRQFKARESAQEGHEATRPTEFEVLEAGDTPQERALYRLIWQRAVASQMAEAKYATRTAVLSGGEFDGKPVTFTAKGRTLLEPGWLSLTKGDQAEEQEAEVANPIPKLAKGSALAPTGEVVAKKTRAPARLTDASLIKILDERGIGRPSTFQSMVKTLLDRGYATQTSDMRLFATDLGIYVYQTLNGRFGFMDFDYTRDMEARLDEIAQGRAKYVDTVAAFESDIDTEVTRFLRDVKPRFPCPTCGRPMHRIEPDDKEPFWGCSGYPDDCKTTRPDANGKPGAAAGPALSAHKCRCGKPLIHLKRAASGDSKGYDFWGCSDRGTCSQTYPNKNGKPDYAATMKKPGGVQVGGKKPAKKGLALLKKH